MILGKQSGLGRGLGAMIPPQKAPPAHAFADHTATVPSPISSSTTNTQVPWMEVAPDLIDRNPHQPRIHFDHAKLDELVTSIKEHGVLQPLVVTRIQDGRYQLIAGERRLRAAMIAGLHKVPVIIREAGDQEQLEIAIIENIQRQELNPIEEAHAYIRLADEFKLTQDEIAKKVGKSRPQIANTIRLLQLSEDIKQALIEGKISASNARTLLSIPSQEDRIQLFQAMLAGNFTVRQTEARIPHPRRKASIIDPNIVAAEDGLRQCLQAKVRISRTPKGEGEIRISFFSDEELLALIEKLKKS